MERFFATAKKKPLIPMGISCSTCDDAVPRALDFAQKRFVGDATYTKGDLDENGQIVSTTSPQRMIEAWRSGSVMRYVFVGVVGQPPVPPAKLVVNHGIVVNERQVVFRNKADMSIETWHVRPDGSIRSIYSTPAASWDTVFTPM